MNQNQIQQLTSHLSQALDQNYDVVNMEAVLSVICALEGTTITKEQLEATRLAKYINQLRRRTKNDQLARRAKSLLKKWREMVGIHQAPNDTNSQQALKPNIESESNFSESGSNMIHQYSSSQPSTPPSQRVISDFHSNIDSSDPPQHQQQQQQQLQQQQHYNHHHHHNHHNHNQHHHQHSNFSSLINNNINIDNSEDSVVSVKTIKHEKNPAAQSKSQKSTATFISEHSNSLPNDKINEASVVIDIVSDSDENDSNTQKFATTSSSLALPTVYSRPKKTKKDKKRKERDEREKHAVFNLKDGAQDQSKSINRSSLHRIPGKKNFPTDSEILSLSNSSMSSILSGDALTGNTQSRFRANAADLTFAGRFKSVSRLDTAEENHSLLVNGQKTVSRAVNESSSQADQGARKIYEELINNDSSTSCSRLSSYEDLEAKSSSQSHAKTSDEPTMPKKRGRKKGSKGVDSVIAKESSLSQQIFFGSGVKKVKTTKELFNDIQSRKLGSTSFNRGETVLPATNNNKITSNNNTNRNRDTTRTLPHRPASSCSETSMHSPHTLETYSTHPLHGTGKNTNTLDDAGNTDSDTITSEPSGDSMKCGRSLKRTNSLDSSNSNSQQTSNLGRNADGVASATATGTATEALTKYSDVTTQLMHLARSFSPLCVEEAERLYQAQLTPCTCIILEELPAKAADGQDTSENLDPNTENSNGGTYGADADVGRDRRNRHNDQSALKLDHGKAMEPSPAMPPKPVKSIFDLDFDDDEDPLHTIIKTVSPPASNSMRNFDEPDEDIKSSNVFSPLLTKNAHEGGLNSQQQQDQDADADADADADDVVPEPVSIYTVHEDPDCVARQRFEVQTNDVTQFHINALHNYYVPNINGNWNSLEVPALALHTTLSQYVQSLEAYEVGDGSDVVPKYGSLTYERIRKDLSSLQLARIAGKHKVYKTFIPPFLGVAKCLPTCRRAARLLKQTNRPAPAPAEDDEEVKELIAKKEAVSVDQEAFSGKQSASPLRVEIEELHNCADHEIEMDWTLGQSPQMSSDATSNNLLQLANSERPVEQPEVVAQECVVQSEPNNYNTGADDADDDGEGSCSNSSLQLTQNSINEKLRGQRSSTDQAPVEHNRKKRRKGSRHLEQDDEHSELLADSEPAGGSGEKPRIKRIKIAINGNVATQRQISHLSSSNNSSEDEHDQEPDDDNEYGDDARSELSDPGPDDGHRVRVASEDEHEGESYMSQSTIDDLDDGHLENENDNDNDNDDEPSNDEEYAIVQRPMLGADNNHNHNHIVLTIKKTPSKINSPVNYMSAMSPIVTNSCYSSAPVPVATIEADQLQQQQQELEQQSNVRREEMGMGVELEKDTRNSVSSQLPCVVNDFLRIHRFCRRRRRRLRHRFRRPLADVNEAIDLELKHLFHPASTSATSPALEKKIHRKLFFANELCREDGAGHKQRIINYSSSSSSGSGSNTDSDSGSGEEDEQEEVKMKARAKVKGKTQTDLGAREHCQIAFSNRLKVKNETEPSADEQLEELYLDSSDGEASDDVKIELKTEPELGLELEFETDPETELPMHNNGMLPTFDAIYAQHCDDVKICYNNNNNNKLDVVKTHGQVQDDTSGGDSQLETCVRSPKPKPNHNSNAHANCNEQEPALEYRTGIRVKEEATTSSTMGPSTRRIQQFKEWHQVLELQSYNNEPLIVLPYVVLE